MENSFLTEARDSCDQYEKMLAQVHQEHADALAAVKKEHEQELATLAQSMQEVIAESAKEMAELEKERAEAFSAAEEENKAALALADQKMTEAVTAERRKLEMAQTKFQKDTEFRMQEELTLQRNQMEREKYEAESRSDKLQQQLNEMKLEALAIRDAMSAEMIKSAHLSASLVMSETKRDRFEAMCALLESEVASLNQQCEQIMDTLGETESDSVVRVRKIASLEKAIAQTKNSLTVAETNLAESNLNLQNAETQLAQLQKTNSELESEITRLDARQSETEKAHEKQLATLQRELSKQQEKSLLELREKLETQHAQELEDLANRHQKEMRTQRKELSANGLQQSSQAQLRLDELEEEVLELKRAHSREVAKLNKAVSVSGEEAIKDLEARVEEAERVGACWKKDAERLQKALHRAIEMGKASLEEFEKEVDGERDLWDLERKALMARIGTLETRLDTISETLKAASESQKNILSEPIHKSIMSATTVPPTAPTNNVAVPRRRARHSDVSQLLELSAEIGKSAKKSQKQAVSKSSLRKVQPPQDSDSEEIVPETQPEDALSSEEETTVTERRKERTNQSDAEPRRQKHRKNTLSDDDAANEEDQESLKPPKASKVPSTKKRAAPSNPSNLNLPAQSNMAGSDAPERASRKSNKRISDEIDSHEDETDVIIESALPSQPNAGNEVKKSNIMPADADASKSTLEKNPKKSTKKAKVVLPNESRDASEGLNSEQAAPREKSSKTGAKPKKQASTNDDEFSGSEDKKKDKVHKTVSKPKKTASKKDDEDSGSEEEKEADQPAPRQASKRAAAVGKAQPYWVIGSASSESSNTNTKPSNKKRSNFEETPDAPEETHHLEEGSEEISERANPSIGNAEEEEPTDRVHAAAKISTPQQPLKTASKNPAGKEKKSQQKESDTTGTKDDQPENSKKSRVRKEKKDAPSKSSEQKEPGPGKTAKRKPEENEDLNPLTIQSSEDSEVRHRENKSDAVEKKKRKLATGKVTAAEETDEDLWLRQLTPAANPVKGALRLSLEPNKKGIFSFSKPSLTGLPGFQGLISGGTPSNPYQSLGHSLNTSALSEFEKARTMRQGQKRLDALKAGQASRAAAENGGA
ncbi:hypothetical protein HDU78_004350 [Chytriomyces hyalinus]|nr:hypothetical protein HDU78_004350 [Chytriomyces hyalinus]